MNELARISKANKKEKSLNAFGTKDLYSIFADENQLLLIWNAEGSKIPLASSSMPDRSENYS